MQNKCIEKKCHCHVISVKKTTLIAKILGKRRRGGGVDDSNTMANYYAQGSLQIRSSECLNVCEWMNVTGRMAVAPKFHLLSRNSSMSEKNFR